MSERPPPQQHAPPRPSEFTKEINELIKSGRDHFRAGRLDQAWAAFESALRRAPDDADALHNAGLVLLMREKYAEAAKYLGRAEGALAADAYFNANYGLALRGVSEPEAAKIRFRRALAARPDHAVALYNFALLLLEDRDWRPAAELLERLAALKPQEAEVSFLLGRALAGQGLADAARERFGRALRLAPEDEDIRLGIAEFELDRGRPEAAESALAEIVARARNLNVPLLLAEVRERLGDASGREQCLARAREIEPRAVDVMYEAACASQEAGSAEVVAKLFRRCLALDPGHIPARVALDRLLPNIYATDAEIESVRRRYEAGLESLERMARDPATSDAVLGGIFGGTNFYLAYQERNDRDLQVRYGRLVSDALRARIPLPGDGSRSMPPPEPDGRLRIGIFTRFFHKHTVSRLYAGWFENIDRRRFKLYGYNASAVDDNVGRMLAGRCDAFRPLGRDILSDESRPHFRRFADLCRAVDDDRLHVLLFPELGMDPTTFYAAARGLAPVQAVGIGHPVTTGLPTVDYFLSGELIEPEGADAHYSEKLIRLPNLSLRLFDTTAAPAAKRRARADFGFAPDEIVYLAIQSLMKYLPRYDRIFPAIAKAVPQARFAFIRLGRVWQEGVMFQRLTRAFEAEGLERDRFCRFFDPLPPGEFGDLNHAADVSLDTPGWSGGNTTHESLGAGLPVVTLPGEFMRGRVSHGMLRMIGVEDTVAKDVDDYIVIAIRLGREPAFRTQVRARIAANRAKLYGDEACVRGLEDFLVQAVAAANPAAHK